MGQTLVNWRRSKTSKLPNSNTVQYLLIPPHKETNKFIRRITHKSRNLQNGKLSSDKMQNTVLRVFSFWISNQTLQPVSYINAVMMWYYCIRWNPTWEIWENQLVCWAKKQEHHKNENTVTAEYNWMKESWSDYLWKTNYFTNNSKYKCWKFINT